MLMFSVYLMALLVTGGVKAGGHAGEPTFVHGAAVHHPETVREELDPRSHQLASGPQRVSDTVQAGPAAQPGGPGWRDTDAGQTHARVGTGVLDAEETGSDDELFQESLHCIGTEPFWSLKVDSRVRFARMAEPYTILSGSRATPSSNHTNVWSLEARGVGSERALLFLRRTDQCSDDMSDFRYRYEVFVRISGDVYSGCCNRLP